jgi:signal transduction histidine kinase
MEVAPAPPVPARVEVRSATPFPIGAGVGVAAVALAVGAGVVGLGLSHPAGAVGRAALAATWAAAGVVLSLRRPAERLGRLVAVASLVAGAGSLAAAAVDNGVGLGLAELGRALAVALLPILALHLLVSLPDGSRTVRWRALSLGYAAGTGLGLVLWTGRPALPLWPVVVESAIAGVIGLAVGNRRYRRARGVARQRLQWFGWALAVSAEVIVVAVALRLLAGSPHGAWLVAGAATLPVPVSLMVGSSRRILAHIDRLLVHTVSALGLSGVVVAVYLVIVVGLGRVPTHQERSILLLSMTAAAAAALLYLPAREYLGAMANRVVYGAREAPDEVLRTFGSRLTRAVPLDELLLQVAESLRKTLTLRSAEIWTGTAGHLERAVSVPTRPVATLTLTPNEQDMVARAGVCGQAWLSVWLPQLLEGRGDAVLRVAPISHAGTLLGLIVVDRPAQDDAFRLDDDVMLTELARQFGLALHNVELDSALQSSLEEVKRQADELRASRARIVAASDAARRQIERNLHDGAQQHLVALAVNIRLIRQLADADPSAAKDMLDQLGKDVQEAVQQLRELAHGIYPPLLMDRGLREALNAAAARASVDAQVNADRIGRYQPDIEAAVYFCCLEAMQNAAKYAGDDATVKLAVWEDAGGLLFEVADNGVGFDMGARTAPGAGFVNMGDRVGAIGGTFSVRSAPGQGTRISGRIPLPEPALP